MLYYPLTKTRQAMQRCKSSIDAKYKTLLARIQAVVFCGTPHRGADAAAWGHLAANIVTMALQSSNSRLLSDLRVDSQILDLVQEDFLRILYEDKIKVHSFQESRGVTGIKGFSGKVRVYSLHLCVYMALIDIFKGCR